MDGITVPDGTPGCCDTASAAHAIDAGRSALFAVKAPDSAADTFQRRERRRIFSRFGTDGHVGAAYHGRKSIFFGEIHAVFVDEAAPPANAGKE